MTRALALWCLLGVIGLGADSLINHKAHARAIASTPPIEFLLCVLLGVLLGPLTLAGTLFIFHRRRS